MVREATRLLDNHIDFSSLDTATPLVQSSLLFGPTRSQDHTPTRQPLVEIPQAPRPRRAHSFQNFEKPVGRLGLQPHRKRSRDTALWNAFRDTPISDGRNSTEEPEDGTRRSRSSSGPPVRTRTSRRPTEETEDIPRGGLTESPHNQHSDEGVEMSQTGSPNPRDMAQMVRMLANIQTQLNEMRQHTGPPGPAGP